MVGETPTFLLLGGVIVLILMAVGVFSLVLVYFSRSQAHPQETPRPRPAPATPPAEPEPEPKQKQSTPAPAEMPAHPGEVMRVIRDDKTGRILVQVEGEKYTHIREIQDAQVGRRVLWAIADLIRFTGGMAANPRAVRSIARSIPEQAETHPGSSDTPDRPTPPADQPTITRLSATPPLQPPERPQRYSMVDFFRRGFQTQPITSAPSPLSFIDEIEAILQQRISQLPAPLSQTVHVRTSSEGRLQIEVGLSVYSSPDEVPDPQIRDLIKASVAEWENR